MSLHQSKFGLFRLLCVVSVLAIWTSGTASGNPRSNVQEIDSLLAFIGRQQGIEFVRNGRAHSATEAVSHLRMKWKRAGNRIKTTEDFIKHCATRSYFTGSPYRVRYSDGSEKTAETLLTAELRRLRGHTNN